MQDKINYDITNPTSIQIIDSVSFEQVDQWLQRIYAGFQPGKPRVFVNFGEEIRTDAGFQKAVQELVLSPKSPCPWSDISFVTADGKKTRGHKVICQANSGLFKALFETFQDMDMADIQELELPLSRLNLDQFQLVKEFLYGCPIVLAKSTLLKVFSLIKL